MAEIDQQQHTAGESDEALALSALEYDQLVDSKKRPIPRRHFKGPELAVIWGLRIYLIFMVVALVIQIVHAGGH
jgi:hypothetical protein